MTRRSCGASSSAVCTRRRCTSAPRHDGGSGVSWSLVALAAALAGAGAVSGFLAGLFGVGGGSIVVAALYQAFTYAGMPDELCMRMSLGTAFAIMVPTSAASFMGHLRRGSADAS